MQTIIRSAIQFNFSQIDNDLLASAMPPKPQKVLLYLLSKPADWQIRFNDIKHRLGLSTYATRQALKWLLDHGYAVFDRLKSGHTIWRIFDKPQPIEPAVTRMVEPHVEIPHVENQHELVILRQSEILKTTTPIQDKPIQNVVVDKSINENNGDTITVPGIDKRHQKVAKKEMEGLNQQQVALICSIFASAIQKRSIGNPIGYFIQLVKACKNGTLSQNNATTEPPIPSLEERLAKQKECAIKAEKRGEMTFEEWKATIRKQYGDDIKF